MAIKDFKELKVWEKSFLLAKVVYVLTSDLPTKEQFGLQGQLRRAAVSIPSNIAEGQKRGGKNEFRQFLFIARGSAAEVETQLLLLKELYPSYNTDEAFGLLKEVERMLEKLILVLKN